MKNVIVTGAGGMVGSHMVEFLKEQGYFVVGTYYKPTVDITDINPLINMIECDIRYPENIKRILEKYEPSIIFHLAAQSYPTVSWDKPYETMDININGTIAVFEAIKHIRISKRNYSPIVLVACSSAEYGATLDKLNGDKAKETDALLPLHPYGVSKVAQDLLSYQYFMNDGIKVIRARIFNTTGTRKINDVTSDFIRRAISLEKEPAQKNELRVGNINTYRAIMDVRDLIRAFLLLVEKGKYGEVYNISSEKVYQISDIINIIEKNIGISFDLKIDTKLLRPTDERIIIGDVTKLKNDTGWEQNYTLEDTIKEMLDYWRKKHDYNTNTF